MFKGINKYGMIKNGTIAVITMFGVGIFFGQENLMLLFPIALTSAVLGRQNIHVKTFSKIFKIMCLDIVIVTAAYLAGANMYLGILINLISIFLITYAITVPYDPTIYKPFVMLYIFTQYAWVPLKDMPARYLSIIFGLLVVVICNLIIKGINEKMLLGNSINKSLTLIMENLNEILAGEYDEKKELECTNIMRGLAYKIYVSRYKGYLTTNLGQVQFKLFMDIEHLNLYLRKIKDGYLSKEISKAEIERLIYLINQIKSTSSGERKPYEVVKAVNKYINKYMSKTKYSYEISVILINLSKNINSLYGIKKKDINKLYDGWERSEFDKAGYMFKEYFKKDSIRFKFAMRMSITLTIALFLGEVLGFYKIIWAIITVMSVMQPYYEDTLKKSKERVAGNMFAIIFTGIAINLIDNKYFTIGLLFVSLYLLYGFKEYYKISLFAAIASICLASMSSNLNELLIYRVLYVIVGVIIVMLANKVLFPYRLKDGIRQMEERISRYVDVIMDEGKKYLNNEGNIHVVRDLIIHSTLMNQKLYIRNLQYADEEVDKFIYRKNFLVIEIGYAILMSYGKSEEYKNKKLEQIEHLCLGEI